MGCLTLFLLVAFLACALAGGAFFAVHHLRHKYSSSEPIVLPEVITSDSPTAVENTAIEGAPPTPQASGTPVQVREAEKRWKSFEKAKDEHHGNIEMSAGEINALLQSHKNTRGKAFVSIQNNVAHVRVSIPLKNVPLMKDRYLNGEATVEASPDGDPNKARISNVVLSGNSVSENVLDQRLFGWSSIRGMISTWLNKEHITSFRIENDRVIGSKGGGRFE